MYNLWRGASPASFFLQEFTGGKLKFLWLAIALVIILTLLPSCLIIYVSFFKTNLITWEFVGFQNYERMWRDFGRAVINSFLYVGMIPVFGTGLSVFVTLMIVGKKRSVQGLYRGIFYIPVFASGMIIAQFWKWFYSDTGFANMLIEKNIAWFQGWTGIPAIGVAVMTSTVGGQIVLLTLHAINIDPQQYEAAKIDGAGWFQIKRYIVLPQMRKAISVVLLFSIVGIFQMWETIYILAPFKHTASMMFRIFADGFMYGKYGIAAAECVVMVIIVVSVSILRQRVAKKE